MARSTAPVFRLFHSRLAVWEPVPTCVTGFFRKNKQESAKAHGIGHATLSRYCKSLRKLRDQGSTDLSVGYRSGNIFSVVQEEVLADHLTQAADQEERAV